MHEAPLRESRSREGLKADRAIGEELMRSEMMVIIAAIDRILASEGRFTLAELCSEGMTVEELRDRIIRNVWKRVATEQHTLVSRALAIEKNVREELDRLDDLRKRTSDVRHATGTILAIDTTPSSPSEAV